MTTPTPNQLRVLWHALGLSRDKRTPYRNFFMACESHYDHPTLVSLRDQGLMTSKVLEIQWGGGECFYVTDKGKELALKNLPPAPKRTRYRKYLSSECDESFAEWLGIRKPEYEYGDRLPDELRTPSRREYVRMKSRRAVGDWCVTKKAAKASYRTKLQEKRNSKI